MPIKNYTTKVDVYESLGEIQGARRMSALVLILGLAVVAAIACWVSGRP